MFDAYRGIHKRCVASAALYPAEVLASYTGANLMETSLGLDTEGSQLNLRSVTAYPMSQADGAAGPCSY